jgi:hypothetical protein
MHTIQNDTDFLKVFLSGKVDQTSLLEAQRELMLHPEYPFKNSLWVFDPEFECCFSNGGFPELIGRIKLFCPVDATKQKAALVATCGVHFSIMHSFCEDAELAELPFQFKAFYNCEHAEEWLRED